MKSLGLSLELFNFLYKLSYNGAEYNPDSIAFLTKNYALNKKFEHKIGELNAEHLKEIASINQSHQNNLVAKDREVASLHEQLRFEKERHALQMREKAKEHDNELNAMALKTKNLTEQLDNEIKEKRLLKAQYLALKKEVGRLTSEDDCITELKFDELQRTFELFEAYFLDEWKKAKRHIRRSILKTIIKKNNDNDETGK